MTLKKTKLKRWSIIPKNCIHTVEDIIIYLVRKKMFGITQYLRNNKFTENGHIRHVSMLFNVSTKVLTTRLVRFLLTKLQ